MSRSYLRLECACLFVALPLVVVWVHQRWLMIALLWGGAAYAYTVLRRTQAYRLRTDWNAAAVRGEALRRVLTRLILCVLLIAAFVWCVMPERAFSLIRERPYVWMLVMVLYPLLSVIPQELIYRAFFLRRYASLFPQRAIASAVAFSFAHLVFMNGIALSFTFVGGLLFADTYLRHRSLALVCVEHALYGCALFTLGLGWYFYGTAWSRH